MDKSVIEYLDLIILCPSAVTRSAAVVSTQLLLSESEERGRTGGESLINHAKRISNLETIDT